MASFTIEKHDPPYIVVRTDPAHAMPGFHVYRERRGLPGAYDRVAPTGPSLKDAFMTLEYAELWIKKDRKTNGD